MKIQDILISETEDWIALNKPSGLLSIPDREGKDISLKKILKEKYQHIYTVHRLDQDTSGLIIFAKNEKAHQYLSTAFEERKTEKIYLGLLHGTLIDKKGTIDAPIAEHPANNGLMVVYRKGKESRTDYEVVEEFRMYSWVQFQILTGRTHQIRVHVKNIGHPVACDQLYGDGKPVLLSSLKNKKFKLSKNEEDERPLLNRLALHSFQFDFTDQNGKNIFLEAAIPKDLRATINQLRKWSSR
ncbi:MAG: RNA pseudouridine synthase [Bacteroidetes bacterium]|nr:RNA pseudouridine synthase [Bacteroidota bacterium]MBS1931253.1 RNA pseudouridine synthase [Bacteroidota bacterium]